MKTYFECLECFVRQATQAARHVTKDPGIHEEILRRVFHELASTDLRRPTPLAIGIIHRIVREVTGDPDPYSEAKIALNGTALELYPRFEKMVRSSEDPIDTALRLSIAGNVIDMIVNPFVNITDIEESVRRALSDPLPPGSAQRFREAVGRAKKILYLGDNAGEIVLDRVLIEQLPRERITYVVKAGPVVNDVTILDARSVGMTELVEVIDNGSDLPGTILEFCSETFRKIFEEADMVVSKGQGNYESISEVDKSIFFVFKAKCEVMTIHLGLEQGSSVLATAAQLREIASALHEPSPRRQPT